MFEQSLRNTFLQNSEQAVPFTYFSQFESIYERYCGLVNREICLLFSGGLDTTFLAHFFQHVIHAKVTAINVDVGGILPDRDKALHMIKSRAVSLDVNFVHLDGFGYIDDLLIASVRAEAQLLRGHHPSSSLSRVAIVRAVLDYMKFNSFDVVMHGSNGHQNNVFRFHYLFRHYSSQLSYPVEIVTPNVEDLFSREAAHWYLDKIGVFYPGSHSDISFSSDDNIFGLEAEDANLCSSSCPFDMNKWIDEAASGNFGSDSNQASKIEIEFSEGMPVSLKVNNGSMEQMSPIAMLRKLNEFGFVYRIGIVDYVEARPTGIRAREVHFAPGMKILIFAHHLLRNELLHPLICKELEHLSRAWSDLVMTANLYFHDLRIEADDMFRIYDKKLSGVVSLRVGYQFIDMPSIDVFAPENNETGVKVSTQLIESYYTKLTTNARSRSDEFSALAHVANNINSLVVDSYTHFGSTGSDH